MTLGRKFLKPRRFLSFFLAFGLGGMLFAQTATAESLKNGSEACVDKFGAAVKSFIKDPELKNFPKLDISKLDSLGNNFCAANSNAKHDVIATEQSKRPKPSLSDGVELATTFEGACQSSYQAVDLVFERLLKARKETCAKVYTEIEKKFPNCLDAKPADSCKGKLKEIVALYSDGKAQLRKDVERSVAFLEKHAEWNSEAEKKFQKDLDLLKGNRNNQELLEQPSAAPPAVAFAIAAPEQGADKLSTYLKNLEKNGKLSQVSANQLDPVMSPKAEQSEAKKMVLAFAKKLKDVAKQENAAYSAQLAEFSETLQKNLDSIPGEESYLKKIGSYAPAAAPLAGSLLQNNGGNVASTVASSSSGALPALALMGAAGAAGMAMGQKSAASSGLGGSAGGVEGPVMTPANKAAGTDFNAGEKAQTPAPVPGSPLSPAGSNDTEKAADNESAGAANAAMAAAMGGGASAMPGKSKNREVASVPTSAPAAGGEEALKNFGGELRPPPRPQASPDSAGNEVSNLLGKMKDLFNMDDSFGGGGMPPPDLSAGGVAHPASGSGAGGEYTDDYTGSEEYQADGEYEGGTEEDYQGSRVMGDMDVTLFRRVHARHVKCIEKGLVLLMSQDLPE